MIKESSYIYTYIYTYLYITISRGQGLTIIFVTVRIRVQITNGFARAFIIKVKKNTYHHLAWADSDNYIFYVSYCNSNSK